ncbi:MAG TPA: BadF/BadG/BcrA/BcrD ATPase family protein, partial [Thermoplasmata archaeon]|nr:BadF/BadG/BcrA/BcrD ATPase family protein [Thermoplasmata archaeon]
MDAGSTYTKGILLDPNRRIMSQAIQMTGVNLVAATNGVYRTLLASAGVSQDDVACLVGTGYGRFNIKFGHLMITEISCHAKGAHHLFPG